MKFSGKMFNSVSRDVTSLSLLDNNLRYGEFMVDFTGKITLLLEPLLEIYEGRLNCYFSFFLFEKFFLIFTTLLRQVLDSLEIECVNFWSRSCSFWHICIITVKNISINSIYCKSFIVQSLINTYNFQLYRF